MAFPDTPCDSCPRVARGLSLPCRAMGAGHSRFCVLAAEGHEGYIALLCDATPPEPVPGRAAILARRANKPRIALGSKPPQGRR